MTFDTKVKATIFISACSLQHSITVLLFLTVYLKTTQRGCVLALKEMFAGVSEFSQCTYARILFLFGQILEHCALARLRPRLILKHFPSLLRGVISHGFSSLQRAGFAVMQCSLSWLNAENTHAARRIGSDQRQLRSPLIRNYQTYFLIKAKARLLEAVTSDIIDIAHIKQYSCSVLA